MNKVVSTASISHNEWLEQRRSGIGGSDAAAIVALNPYKSAFEVWMDKRGLSRENPDNEAMRQGRDLEEYVARRFAEETGNRVRRENHILSDDAQPYMLANVDRVLIGKKEGLECKTMNPRSKYASALEDNSVPPSYYVQCQWYMAVTGWNRWHLAILVFGEGFYRFEIERNEEDIAALRKVAEHFWTYNVLADNPPPPDGSKACHDAVLSIYPRSSENESPLDMHINDILELKELEDQKKDIERRIQRIKDEIMLLLGDSETGNGDGFRVTAKTQVRRTFDYKRYAKDHPEQDLSGYFNESLSRPFRYKIF